MASQVILKAFVQIGDEIAQSIGTQIIISIPDGITVDEAKELLNTRAIQDTKTIIGPEVSQHLFNRGKLRNTKK